jgi:hypothetical protein
MAVQIFDPKETFELLNNLKPIPLNDIKVGITNLLIPGETVLSAFRTQRDQLVFTSERIIDMDIQGITGKRKSFKSYPYHSIKYFGVQTPGFGESIIKIFGDAELELVFNDGRIAHFEFRGDVDIFEIARSIGKEVLNQGRE